MVRFVVRGWSETCVILLRRTTVALVALSLSVTVLCTSRMDAEPCHPDYMRCYALLLLLTWNCISVTGRCHGDDDVNVIQLIKQTEAVQTSQHANSSNSK